MISMLKFWRGQQLFCRLENFAGVSASRAISVMHNLNQETISVLGSRKTVCVVYCGHVCNVNASMYVC